MLLTYVMPILAACTLAAPAPTAPPHPYHLSLAEVECNTAKRELQVSLAVLAIDFEKTLSRRAGKRVNLDRTEGIDKIIEDYLAERFVVTLPDGAKPRPSYVGREDETKLVWIYFTVPLTAKQPAFKPSPDPAKKTPKGSLLFGVRLENRVLMELNADQFNRVSLREGRWRRAMRFEKDSQEQVLRTKAPVNGNRAGPRKDRIRRERTVKNPALEASKPPLGRPPSPSRERGSS